MRLACGDGDEHTRGQAVLYFEFGVGRLHFDLKGAGFRIGRRGDEAQRPSMTLPSRNSARALAPFSISPKSRSAI